MLVKDDLRLQEFYSIVDEEEKYDTFVDAFSEFVHELNCADLSEETLQILYDLFIKDMRIYFENKHFEED